MAKNYTIAEAVRIIHEGKDLEAISDIGRRYPILMHKVTTVAAVAGQAFVDLMSFMPDYLTANKVNTAMKAAIGETEATESDEDGNGNDTESEATEGEATEAGTQDQDFESMSAKQMWDLLGKAGKRKLAKSTKKADLVEACKQAFGAGATTEAEAEEAETETEADPYAGKSAMELFKECKKRGIKAAPKKPAKFYADLLIKNDAESNETEAESEDEWDEEPKEETKETKSTKKTAPKNEKKATKKSEPKTESDDDEWDI